MKLHLARRLLRPRAAHAVLLGAAVALATSCNEPLDTQRTEGPRATLGDDLFGLVCDRLGAGILQEDLTGESYQGLCHYDAKGGYGDTVDVSRLPKTTSSRAAEARRLSIAKMERLGTRRADLVKAFNAIFPDVDIDNVATADPNDKISNHDALLDLSQRVAELYDTNPYEVGPMAKPLAPAATQGLGQLFDSMGKNPDVLGVMARMWGRRGYRPSTVGLGAIRSTLGYPSLRELTSSTGNLLGPNGSATPELRRLLQVAEKEMEYANPEISTLPDLTVNAPIGEPNRPRTDIEIFKTLMLTENDRYAPSDAEPMRFIALRDKRGYAVPDGGASFVDNDGDGLPDVDGFGRFVDGSGSAISIDTPFSIPGIAPLGPVDGYGRPSGGLYQYVDTSRTPAAALGDILTPLLDATEYASSDDPDAYQQEYETLMYALAGSYALFGEREDAEYDFESDRVVPAGTGCPSCFKYSRFRGEDSPFAGLAHSVGQILADKDSDALLLGLIDLAENHEDELARVVAAALRVKEIANQHDDLAAKGQIPPAELPYENPVWDEAADVLSRVAGTPNLVAKLVGALADPAITTPTDGSNHLGETIALFASTRDGLDYDHGDLNGPSVNVTDSGFSTADPHNLVDWNAPRTGANRSVLEKSILLIHDAAYAKACNKPGAVVKSKVLGINLTWPLSGSYDECELFELPNLAAFYFGSILQPAHPKRSEFVLKDNTLNDILNYTSFIASADEVMQDSSGINGMTTHPSSSALNRLVYFGATSSEYPNMPDHDSLNEGSQTDKFISNLMDPAPSYVCPPNANGVGHCSSPADTLRIRTRQSMFAWERRGFYAYLRPIVTTFVNVSCSDDVSICDKTDFTGENMFLDLGNAFWWNYPGPDHGAECDSSGTPQTNRRYCSGAGINRYEPIIQKAMSTDLIPALHAFSIAAKNDSVITIARGPKAGQQMTGADVLGTTAKILFSKDYAGQVGMKDRFGNKGTTWTDGTPQAQVTGYTLFADALHEVDVAFANAADGDVRKAKWRRARSQLVDSLFATEGEGATTHFKNRALVPILVTTLKLMREQLNANCKTRETDGKCDWARQELGKKVGETLSSPLFAAIVDLGEQMQNDPAARRSLERYLTYLLKNAGTGESLQGTLASLVDVMQVLADDEKMVPILRAASVTMKLHDAPDGPGCADTTIRVLKALSSDDYDRYHALDFLLQNLVNPMVDENGNPGLSPIEVVMDVVAEVDREDASLGGEPLSPEDYGYIFGVVRDFFTDDTRGLEQLYAIVARRRKS